MPVKAHDVYHQVRTTTADPIELTTLLFDAAVNALRKARIHHKERASRRYAESIEKAYLIIGELLATLDLEQGELPVRLAGIYTYCLSQLTEASLGDAARLDEVEKHIGRISGAWKVAAESYRSAPEYQQYAQSVA